MVEMVLDQHPLGLTDRLFYRLKLLGDVEARAAALDHVDDAAKMSVGALQSLGDLGVMMVYPYFGYCRRGLFCHGVLR